MNITFRQLQIFIRLAELRSISAVARACHVTQPTVSMQLKEMTDTIGIPLYEVIGKKLYLTKAGEELASTARTLAHEWGSFEQQIAAMKGLTEGSLRVAVVSTAKYFIPRMLGDFCREYPEIDIALEVQNRDGVVERLRNNLDDIYIMSTPPKDIDVVKQVFLPNPLVVVAPLHHPLAGKKRLQFARLLNERFILRERGSGTRLACEHYFSENKITPVVRLELGSNEAIKQAVAADMGLTILSRHALGDHLKDQNLTVLDVQDFPIMSNWYIVHLQGKRLSPIASNFLGYLSQHAQDKV
ncbi:LysR family transcriptional regulator [Undibacterium pigrum]|uniref:DNA-binding transcriptional LysR family regulator n=1 Tax=Undibacterium pigrum TaxID=401470 RepID=A0A318IY08_9BURK|nr:LysR family transcriptional regulator [Undibacterium pigrum]PXX40195.1 DNA-binding transcriptional LysR family regulator [Undibacterium pigrum]